MILPQQEGQIELVITAEADLGMFSTVLRLVSLVVR